MLNSFEKNEIFMSCRYIGSNNLLPNDGSVINVIGNHILCDYLCDTINSLNKSEYKYTLYQVETSDALTSTVKKQCFLYCLDLRCKDENVLADFEKALSYANNIEGSAFVALVLIPMLSKRDDVHSLSEIELSALSVGTILQQAEDLLSEYCNKLNIKEIRFDNFLIEDSEHNALNLTQLVKESVDNKEIVINSSDAFDIVSACSMSDAINAVFTVMKHGKHGSIYNMSGEALSLHKVKTFIYETLCEYGIKLNFEQGDPQQKKTYRALDNGKVHSLGFSPVCDTDTQLIYALSSMLPQEYNIIKDEINNSYAGKIKYVREIELELLSEIDRICRRNNIQYFLSGGTMLGAVRHKGFIPWDDDIDIAMLRNDYEKFKTACINELPKKYQYQSYTNKDGYHYFFDKITIKDTYFSTKYSDRFDMLKGFSTDVFVFDKTSDNKFFSKLHFKTLMALRLLMNVRWINEPRKDKSYLLSKLLLPILRIFSMDTYSKMYDKLLRKYEKRNTSTVLPPATDHKWRGVMPKKWFETVTDAPFENVMSYIPTGYDDYLKRWYCEDYMDLLPLCQRTGSHDYYRLDLGNEIKTDNEETKHYNYKGELL
ncbi:MAG: LicD family protein [Ruminococcus sp.]|nr:LicD family protein [Ruminococcus sp.]